MMQHPLSPWEPISHPWLRTTGLYELNQQRITIESRRFDSLFNWLRATQHCGCNTSWRHCWKLQDQPFAFCGRFGATCILWTGP